MIGESMKFDKQELEKELQNIEQAGWLKNFDMKIFIENIEDLEFTSPNENEVFNAFKIGENNNIINPEDVRVLILGQDPYPEIGKAHGYAFSVLQEYTEKNGIDYSLQNIYEAIKNYKNNINIETIPISKWNTNLENWAKNRNNKILLLNTALTFHSEKLQNIHIKKWKLFFNEIVKELLCNSNKLVIFLWGEKAQKAFSQCLKLKYFKKIQEIQNIKETYLKQLKKNKLYPKRVIKYKNEIDIIKQNKEMKIFLVNHPSPRSENNNGKFIEYTPNHFKACDEFLGKNDSGKYTWRDFPETNK